MPLANRATQQFTKSNVTQLNKESFVSRPKIYSYACRTGNAGQSLNPTINKEFKYGADWLSIVKPKESLAQSLSDHLNADVYAFLQRSNMNPTWNTEANKNLTQGNMTISDEGANGYIQAVKSILTRGRNHFDEVLWNPRGAVAAPNPGTSPGGLPRSMYVFKPGQEPTAEQ